MANTNIMFKVGNVDFSDKVIGENYQVQNDPQYKSWTDANGREHRSVYRWQVSGTFTMLFESIDLYQSFCTTLAGYMQNDTSYPCTVFDNKTDSEVTSDFFITYNASRKIDGMWNDAVGLVKITIKER